MENNENKNTRPRRRKPTEQGTTNETNRTKEVNRPNATPQDTANQRTKSTARTVSKEDELFNKLRKSFKLVVGGVGIVVLVLFIGFIFSFVKYKSAVNSVEKIEKEYEKTIETITAQRDSLQKQTDKDKKFKNTLEKTGVLEVVKDIEQVQEVIKQKELELYNIEKEIETRKSAFKTIKGEPIPLIAGQYIFGLDIPTGRYKVVAKELEGVLVIENKDGERVSEINLGTNKENTRYQKEYVFSAYENFVLKSSKNVEMFLIENVTEKTDAKEEAEEEKEKDKK